MILCHAGDACVGVHVCHAQQSLHTQTYAQYYAASNLIWRNEAFQDSCGERLQCLYSCHLKAREHDDAAGQHFFHVSYLQTQLTIYIYNVLPTNIIMDLAQGNLTERDCTGL